LLGVYRGVRVLLGREMDETKRMRNDAVSQCVSHTNNENTAQQSNDTGYCSPHNIKEC
jgi:hypothetical protein